MEEVMVLFPASDRHTGDRFACFWLVSRIGVRVYAILQHVSPGRYADASYADLLNTFERLRHDPANYCSMSGTSSSSLYRLLR
jgi:hypothetical protein